MEPRSGCPINAAVEVLGDRWSLLVLRDVIFGDRRYFRVLLTGSIEGIASNILADRLVRLVDAGILTRGTAARGQRARYSLTEAGIQTLPILYALGNWGLDWRPGSDELRSRQQLMRDEGPAFIAELMDELRVRHLGAPPKPHHGPGPLDRLDAAHTAAAEQQHNDTRNSYDTIAASYAEETRDLLDRKLHVRAGVVLFAELVRAIGGGPVADIGCGPGHTTALLRELGTDAFGIDLSPAMIEIARREHPGARFEVGSMTDLELADDSLVGVLAWWSLIHIPDQAVPGVLGHFHRVLRPGGVLAVGFHVGDQSPPNTNGDDSQPVPADTHHRPPSRVADWLRAAGFTVEAQHLLRPDDPTPGAILFARRPEAPR